MVACYKKDNNLPILDKKRENEIIEKNINLLNDSSLEPYFKEFFSSMLNVSKNYQSSIIGLKFGLLGKHLSHSQSPLIHNTLFKLKNINASYSLFETDEEHLKDYIDDLRKHKYNGFNVTIPYKVKIMEYLDVIDEEARAIGAVNTVYIKDNLVHGTNTDYFGFIEELKYFNVDVFNKNCYVLGNGGASKAVSKALKVLNANVFVVSRNKSDETISYDEFYNRKEYDLIVNTTPVGMYPNINESVIDKKIASKANTLIDIIFNPKKTLLMSYNNNSYNGFVMLLMQAMKSEDIWLNKTYSLDNSKILRELEEKI
jgi:shikimate dehydrogenase